MNINYEYYGIIILRTKTQGKNVVKTLFQNFLDKFDLEKTKGKIIIVELNQIRVRSD